MPTLTNYQHFSGRHWETGSVHNYYAYMDIKAPHTGQPYSEALMMGVGGGAVMGYFSFAYKGYDPHVALLTRNTFDPLNTLLARLGVVQEVLQTSNAEKGVRNLVDTLENGQPAIVWADLWSLPYNAMSVDKGMWLMFPILVYGYEETTNQVWVADRARVPLCVTPGELAAARGRVKQDKFRIVTLDMPDPDKLSAAVVAGIWDCINLYTEKPPKGSANNFGLKAFHWWAELLTKPKQRMSWEKEFPAGAKMYAGLTSTFGLYGTVGINGDGERALYADFLDEAVLILRKPALKEVAQQFRQSGQAWRDLGCILLPDAVPAFQQTRTLKERKRQLFVEQGAASVEQIRQIDQRLEAIKQEMCETFPLNAQEVDALRAAIAQQVLHIHDLEAAAVAQLRDVMSS